MTKEPEPVNGKSAAQSMENVSVQEILDGKTCVDCGFKCIQGCV